MTTAKTSTPAGPGSGQKESQATILIRLAKKAGAELFHTPNGDPCLFVRVAAHYETHALTSRGARDWLTYLFYRNTGRVPNASALQEAIATLSGEARFAGDEHEVYVRVAPGPNGSINLDLACPDWSRVEITPSGWRVVNDSRVRFRRPRGLLSLPVPIVGGSIKELRPFVNVRTDEDFSLIVAWLIAALRPKGPYPVAVLCGEQGTAKSTVARVMRRSLDPSTSDVRAEPRETRDLAIAATNGHIVSLDNISRLPDWLSDAISRLATGGGFATRTLFTDADETIFDAQRPVILNGIPSAATRPDLIERSIVQTLPVIPDGRRQTEQAFWEAYEQAQPRILGGLLDAVSVGLAGVKTVNLPNKPRMADFACWVVAAEPACPWPPGTFLAAYTDNCQGAIETGLDGDPVAEVARALAPWQGTASNFLVELNQRTPVKLTQRKEWFTRPRQVSDALRRLAPSLRRTGIDVTFDSRAPKTRDRLITLEETGISAFASSSSSPAPGASRQSANISGPRNVEDEANADFPLSSEHDPGAEDDDFGRPFNS